MSKQRSLQRYMVFLLSTPTRPHAHTITLLQMPARIAAGPLLDAMRSLNFSSVLGSLAYPEEVSTPWPGMLRAEFLESSSNGVWTYRLCAAPLSYLSNSPSFPFAPSYLLTTLFLYPQSHPLSLFSFSTLFSIEIGPF